MALELGVKFTRVADEFTSDFQIAKDRAGPLFLSRESDAMFILTAYLKGYKRGNIKIDINEDGTLIAISGERKVKETVIVGWKLYKKDTEIKGFKKVFRIPDGVILDKIMANFNEDESTLTITMPKKVKGIRGIAIDEIEEKQELVKEGSGNLLTVDEKSQRTGTSHQEKDEKSTRNGEDDTANKMPSETHIMELGKETPEEEKQVEEPVSGYSYTDDAQKVHDLENGEKGQRHKGHEKHLNEQEVIGGIKSSPDLECLPSIHGEVPHVETEMSKAEVENQKTVDDIQETSEPKHLDRAESLSMKQLAKKDLQENNNQVPDKTNDIHEEERLSEETEGPLAVEPPEEDLEDEPGKVPEGENKPRGKRCKMCLPIVAGSTLLLSFVVFVFQMIRSKNQTSRRY
ncbi:hypothetical protein Pfo_017138 [Paulownia fortunei]|nr:hypothetical protein Pfo_017138 [Paulownia fortunei]